MTAPRGTQVGQRSPSTLGTYFPGLCRPLFEAGHGAGLDFYRFAITRSPPSSTTTTGCASAIRRCRTKYIPLVAFQGESVQLPQNITTRQVLTAAWRPKTDIFRG